MVLICLRLFACVFFVVDFEFSYVSGFVSESVVDVNSRGVEGVCVFWNFEISRCRYLGFFFGA